MKKLRLILFIIVPLMANPVEVQYISEVQITENGWFIEVDGNLASGLKLIKIASAYGVVYLNDTITVNSGYLVLTPDSVQSDLTMNPEHDNIQIICADFGLIGAFRIGYNNDNVPIAPKPTQSICYDMTGNYYYLDNSPTIGLANDEENAIGIITGVTTNNNGNPLNDVIVEDIVYNSGRTPFDTDTTGIDGAYTWQGLSMMTSLKFKKEGYQTTCKTLMVFPDSTITLNIIMQTDIDTALALSYLPMQVGNYWFYSCYFAIPDIRTTTITDIFHYDGNTYYQFVDSSLTYNQALSHYSLCSNGEGRIFKSDGSLWMDFTAPIGNSILVDSAESYFRTIISNNSYISLPAGDFDSCLVVQYDDTTVWDDEITYWFAPNVGLISKYYNTNPPGQVWLESAYINGRYQSVDHSAEPRKFLLLSNYPNPFNPLTTIRYELPRQIHVRLAIFDLLGREVAVLVDDVREPGSNEVVWDAGALASGIYFYQLQTETKVITEKMVLLK